MDMLGSFRTAANYSYNLCFLIRGTGEYMCPATRTREALGVPRRNLSRGKSSRLARQATDQTFAPCVGKKSVEEIR